MHWVCMRGELLLASVGSRRGGQDGDDRDDHQQFNQRERSFLAPAFLLEQDKRRFIETDLLLEQVELLRHTWVKALVQLKFPLGVITICGKQGSSLWRLGSLSSTHNTFHWQFRQCRFR